MFRQILVLSRFYGFFHESNETYIYIDLHMHGSKKCMHMLVKKLTLCISKKRSIFGACRRSSLANGNYRSCS